MLHGVQCAGRRRFHQAGAADLSIGSRRRPSFSFYASGHGFQQRTSSFYKRSHTSQDGDLGDQAREAKQRLDSRLRSMERASDVGGVLVRPWRELVVMWWRKRKVVGTRKRRRWRLRSWEGECAVCLEEMGVEEVEELPCGHRFHERWCGGMAAAELEVPLLQSTGDATLEPRGVRLSGSGTVSIVGC